MTLEAELKNLLCDYGARDTVDMLAECLKDVAGYLARHGRTNEEAALLGLASELDAHTRANDLAFADASVCEAALL